MFRKTCFVLAISSGMAVVASTSYGQESVSVLNYLGQRAERLASQRAPVPETLDAWKEHRAKLVEALNVSLALPDREPMKAAVTDSKQDGDLTVEDVVYLWAEQTYVSATLIRSTKSSGRRPAVIIPSGWLGHYTFLPYRQFVDSLARQGFTVLFIDDPRTGRRQSPHAGLYATAAAAGRPVAGVQVFDVLRGFDYLLTRTDVDSGKIGIAGLGEGALQAYLAAALEERLQFVATVGGTTTYAALIQAAAQSNSPIAPSVFVAGILDFADMDRIAACLAPRSVLIAGSAFGQQFADRTSTRFPSQSVYSNQLSFCDVDNDGDLDIAFADGQGYSSAGAALRAKLYINDGAGFFSDESNARIPVLGWYRGVEFGDIDGDGDWDMVLANDFNRLPVLLKNDGNGFFTDISDQLPGLTLSSARAQFADVDGDGDLDLAFCHSGTSNRFGSNGRPQLYLNDGTGTFSDATVTNTPNAMVRDQQDILFFDMDNDLDLDLHVGSRSTNNGGSQLWRNDGGVFTRVNSALPTDGST